MLGANCRYLLNYLLADRNIKYCKHRSFYMRNHFIDADVYR